jgi:hypothetical protein
VVRGATTKLPPDLAKLPKAQWADVLKAVPAPAGAPPAPKVFFTHKPAELIVFRGQPVYAPIPGTNLSYATNTDSSVFLHKPTIRFPWTGTYAATSQGHNAYSQWGSSLVTNGNNWAQAQHVTNANGTAGSFQTSKGSEGAGFSGANGNSGFVAKDANNNNVYAGADGNVYKKDSSGNWSKWDNGSWTPVDPSTGLQQTKNQNPVGSAKGSATQTPGASSSGTQPGTTSSNGPQAGQNRPNRSQTDQPPAGSASGGSGGSSNLGSQLDDDARSRDRGDQLEQNGRGGGRRGAAAGSRSPRR